MSASDNQQRPRSSSTGERLVDRNTAAATHDYTSYKLAAVSDLGWYQLGDFNIFELCDYFNNGDQHLPESTLVLSEGNWQPLSAIPELMSWISEANTISYKVAALTEFGRDQHHYCNIFELCDFLKNGDQHLPESTLVMCEGNRWQPLSAIPELMSRISEANSSGVYRRYFPQVEDSVCSVDPYGREELTLDDVADKEEEDVSDETINSVCKRKQPKKEAEEQEGSLEIKEDHCIYVTGLPTDVTFEELVDVFSIDGKLKEDERGKPRIKLYTDKATGRLKGDALITYENAQGVKLAIERSNGGSLRLYDKLCMSVSEAKFEKKGEKFISKQTDNNKKKNQKKVELGWGGRDDAKVHASIDDGLVNHTADS